MKADKKHFHWRDFAQVFLAAIVLALFIRSFLYTGYRVPTSSMAPTLLPGDFVFAQRWPYSAKKIFEKSEESLLPPRGSIVVFTYPDRPNVKYVKRVIGLPGDRVEMKAGRVVLNEKYLAYEMDHEKTQKLPLHWQGNMHVFKEKYDSQFEHSVIFHVDDHERNFEAFIVPPRHIFVLGDNRDLSDDSRYWGSVPIERIEGELSFIWLSLEWPTASSGGMPRVRWNRVFSFL